MNLQSEQLNLPIVSFYQPAKQNDTAVQFAPFNAVTLIHRKEDQARTACGLTLPDAWGEWAAMGSFSKHLAKSPNSICDVCSK